MDGPRQVPQGVLVDGANGTSNSVNVLLTIGDKLLILFTVLCDVDIIVYVSVVCKDGNLVSSKCETIHVSRRPVAGNPLISLSASEDIESGVWASTSSQQKVRGDPRDTTLVVGLDTDSVLSAGEEVPVIIGVDSDTRKPVRLDDVVVIVVGGDHIVGNALGTVHWRIPGNSQISGGSE